jgi:hypothetical protein
MNVSATSPSTLPRRLQDAYAVLAKDLQAVFGPRLQAALAFGPCVRTPLHHRAGSRTSRADSLGLVDRVTMEDLLACAAQAEHWDGEGLRMPLLLGRDEFLRSLDTFPLEYDDIIAHHVLLAGEDPFHGVSVPPEDLRRACEARAKGHLIHLREGYLETGGRPGELASLIMRSALPFSALLGNLARLQGKPDDPPRKRAEAIAGASGASLTTLARVLALESDPLLGADEAARLYPEYLAMVERLVAWVDEWSRS